MKALAIMRPAREGDLRSDVIAAADDELTALWELYAEGVVLEMYSPAGSGRSWSSTSIRFRTHETRCPGCP